MPAKAARRAHPLNLRQEGLMLPQRRKNPWHHTSFGGRAATALAAECRPVDRHYHLRALCHLTASALAERVPATKRIVGSSRIKPLSLRWNRATPSFIRPFPLDQVA